MPMALKDRALLAKRLRAGSDFRRRPSRLGLPVGSLGGNGPRGRIGPRLVQLLRAIGIDVSAISDVLGPFRLRRDALCAERDWLATYRGL